MMGKYCDLILIGNNIFTGVSDEPISGAVAIRGNRIFQICSRQEADSLIGPDTKIREFGDKLIMPGFFDGHEHAFLSGIFARAVNLSECRSEREAALKVKAYAEEHPELHWIIGTDWYDVLWTPHTRPTKHSLDKLLPDTPVYLINCEGHAAWINTAAIHESGIADCSDLGEDLVNRDEAGIPTGYIAEAAMLIVARLAFDMPAEVQGVILREFLDRTARLGITSVSNIQCYQGSDIDLGSLTIIKDFESSGSLTTRFFVAVGLTGNLERPRKLRALYDSDKFRFTALKHIIDGTAVGYTALMVEPYSDNPGCIGSTRIPPAELMERVIAADKEGFRVRMHACGDGSVKLGLDCYEAAQKTNGKRDARHTIEHIEIIREEDIPRFAELGVVASMQPEHIAICDEFKDNPYLSRLGKEREHLTWPIRTLLETGAAMQFGTDYPIVDNDPMLAVYRAVTRTFNDGNPAGGWNPKEKISLAQALKCYTYGSAYAAFMEDELGTLEDGKLADIVVLSKNLFDIDPEEYRSVTAVMTIMDGQIIYKA